MIRALVIVTGVALVAASVVAPGPCILWWPGMVAIAVGALYHGPVNHEGEGS
jgi:membrane protein implicated in regulation of membrane protease activity